MKLLRKLPLLRKLGKRQKKEEEKFHKTKDPSFLNDDYVILRIFDNTCLGGVAGQWAIEEIPDTMSGLFKFKGMIYEVVRLRKEGSRTVVEARRFGR